jgi:hypothetical protein
VEIVEAHYKRNTFPGGRNYDWKEGDDPLDKFKVMMRDGVPSCIEYVYRNLITDDLYCQGFWLAKELDQYDNAWYYFLNNLKKCFGYRLGDDPDLTGKKMWIVGEKNYLSYKETGEVVMNGKEMAFSIDISAKYFYPLSSVDSKPGVMSEIFEGRGKQVKGEYTPKKKESTVMEKVESAMVPSDDFETKITESYLCEDCKNMLGRECSDEKCVKYLPF